MKKAFALLAALLVLLGSAAGEEEAFLSVTGLDEMQAKLADGIGIVSAYYTDGYGFSDSGFLTRDPEECLALFEALTEIELAERTNQSITDWYPQIFFTLSDESRYYVLFEGPWLDRGTEGNWEVRGTEKFTSLVSYLKEKYADRPEDWPGEADTQLLPNAVDLYFPGTGWTCSLSEGGVIEAETQVMEEPAGERTWFRFSGLREGGEAALISRGENERALFYLRVDEAENVLIWGVELTGF